MLDNGYLGDIMDIESKMDLLKQVGEEIITEEELKALLETKSHPVAYDGFEPSGNVHIAQGVLRAINVNKLLKAGIKFKMYAADWHAWANNKLEGDLDKIQICGDYLIEVWKAAGMDVDKVEYIRATDIVSKQDFWKTTLQISRTSTVKRIMRCGQIMGRTEEQVQQASQILYPCMQCADIFELEADICQLGLDQRKVNMLAREVGPKLGFWKPVVVSHHMLMGLGKPSVTTGSAVEKAIDMKMSKSKPDTAIFMTDSEKDVIKKINKAHCPEKQIENNPLIDYAGNIVFQTSDTMAIERPEKFGGNIEIQGFDELVKVYRAGELHPMDLKIGVAKSINELLEPVRAHFKKNKKAAKLLEDVNSFKITR